MEDASSNKMFTHKRIVQIIFQAIEEFNLMHSPQDQLSQTVETVLIGSSSSLDSLGLVDLILATEQKINEELGLLVTLADEKAMSQKNSPFRTVKALADYICLFLDAQDHG